MAKLVKIYENGIEKTILTFRGQDFTLTVGEWEEDGMFRSKEKGLDIQVEEAFKDDPDIEEITEIIFNIDDPFDALENLEELESYE